MPVGPVEPDSLLKVGHIQSPYGIKGWVWVHALTDPTDNVFGYAPWYLCRAGRFELAEVAEWRVQGKGLVARLKGSDDRNAVEGLRGVEIWVPKSCLPELAGDDYYWSDLEDLAVYNTEGVFFGQVFGMMETGSNDVLVVRACEGSIDKQERLIPGLPGQVVKQVDQTAHRITVDWDADF